MTAWAKPLRLLEWLNEDHSTCSECRLPSDISVIDLQNFD